MKLYVRKQNQVAAVELTAENLEAVERWCGGSIKGIKRPIAERAIDIQTRRGEERASIGDYIVKDGTGAFSVEDTEQFTSDYVLHDAAGIDQMKLLREEVEKWQGLAMMFMWRMAGDAPMVLSKESIDTVQAHFLATFPVLQASEVGDGIQFQLANAQGIEVVSDGN